MEDKTKGYGNGGNCPKCGAWFRCAPELPFEMARKFQVFAMLGAASTVGTA